MNYLQLALREIEQKLEALEKQRRAIMEAIKASGGEAGTPGRRGGGVRREMSPEARQRISDATKLRWERVREAAAAPKTAPKKKAPAKKKTAPATAKETPVEGAAV